MRSLVTSQRLTELEGPGVRPNKLTLSKILTGRGVPGWPLSVRVLGVAEEALPTALSIKIDRWVWIT